MLIRKICIFHFQIVLLLFCILDFSYSCKSSDQISNMASKIQHKNIFYFIYIRRRNTSGNLNPKHTKLAAASIRYFTTEFPVKTNLPGSYDKNPGYRSFLSRLSDFINGAVHNIRRGLYRYRTIGVRSFVRYYFCSSVPNLF